MKRQTAKTPAKSRSARRPARRRPRRRTGSLAGRIAGFVLLVATVLLCARREGLLPGLPTCRRPAATGTVAETADRPAPSAASPDRTGKVPTEGSADAPTLPDATDPAALSADPRAAAPAPQPTGDATPLTRAEVWPELPAPIAHGQGVTTPDDLLCHTTWCTLDGRTVRNYTMCFDPSKRGALWVAYPLVAAYTGAQPRPDRWAYDPAIDERLQASVVDRSYPDRAYDRGHQIPNADRNRTAAMQAQTFYCSNSTPQAATLNGGAWARLEERIRRSWICPDTLYVVTGAVWETGRTTPDRAGRDCPVPDYYFKVLLRTRRGDVRTAGDRLGSYDAAQLRTIGFWVANAEGQRSFKEWTASVEEIERRTGLEFFPTIPAAAKRQHDKRAWGL